MSAQQGRLEFAPPPTPGLLRAVSLALVAHLALVAALTLGVAWKHDTTVSTVEAELWSAVPQEAAPPPAAPEPQPAPQPEPQPVVKPEPKPEPKPAPPEPPPAKANADIAQAREKARLREEKEQKDRLEKAKLEKEKLAREKLAREKLEKQKQEQLAKEKALKEQRDKKAQAAREAQEAKRLEEDRLKNIQRMQKLAGGNAGPSGSGASSATGSAAQASGPSAGYTGRIVARIKPNITFTETISGNPRAEVEIRVAPTGAILSARITQSSGLKSWDDAVLRAIEKTEMLPKDVDGSIPTSMQIGFRPKD